MKGINNDEMGKNKNNIKGGERDKGTSINE